MRFRATFLTIMLLALAGPCLAQDTGVTVWRGQNGNFGDPDTDPDSGHGHWHGHGHEMAAWIRDAQGRLGAGATSIPKDIQKRFRHAFPAGLFDWARFRVGGTDRFWRQAARRGYGNGLVLVLDDVILFRTGDAARNHTLWYAGLEQARRFRHLGIEKALKRSSVGQRTAMPAWRLGPRTTYTYTYNFLYPRWAPPLGNPPDGTARSPITVPGRIVVEPVNPFHND